MSEIKSSGRPIDQLLEKVLCMNILSSPYFRDLMRLKTYHEVIDEIYVTVAHVEPWMSGNCRGPSTAFSLLYKFFTMKLTVKQMHGLLQHPDSPYIRAIGFLYLRYAADPKTLWSWFEPYLKDDEEFSPGSNGRMTTMGVYVRDLLLGQYYFDTLFPRIPVPVLRTVVANLENMKLPTKHCGVTGESTRGSEETARRPPSVKAALSVSFGQRAPHRASTRDSAPVWRTVTPSSYDRDVDSRQSPNHYQSQILDLSDQDFSERNRGRDRDRERRRDGHKDRNIDRERIRDKDRDRDSKRERDGRYDYDRRSGDRCRKDYGSRGREELYGRESSSYQSWSRSRSPNWRRSQSIHEQTTHDLICHSPFRNESKQNISASSNLAKLKDLYGVLSNQKEGAVEDKGPNSNRASGAMEVMRLGGSSWR